MNLKQVNDIREAMGLARDLKGAASIEAECSGDVFVSFGNNDDEQDCYIAAIAAEIVETLIRGAVHLPALAAELAKYRPELADLLGVEPGDYETAGDDPPLAKPLVIIAVDPETAETARLDGDIADIIQRTVTENKRLSMALDAAMKALENAQRQTYSLARQIGEIHGAAGEGLTNIYQARYPDFDAQAASDAE